MSEQLPFANIVHAVPGRSRLQIPSRREDAAFFSELGRELAEMRGIVEVEPRPMTGSVILWHETPLDAICKDAERAGLFVVKRAPPEEAEEAAPLNPKAAAAVGMVALAALQITRGQVLPPTITLAYYAMELGKWWRQLGPLDLDE